jgi:hypothetical protein
VASGSFGTKNGGSRCSKRSEKLALERLAEESDADGVRRRHAEYLLDLATNAEDEHELRRA